MKQKEVIQNIIKSKSFTYSKDLLSWIKESDDNKKDFIRYKNLWALLQRGKEIDESYIVKDFKSVRKHIKKSERKINLRIIARYAAIIIIALIGGYLVHSLPDAKKVAMNEIYVPNGNRSLISLPDGSKAWLSNGSKIIYPERFTGDSRNVKLEGEAYFSVSHDATKPFIVDIGEQHVKVLGTEFSVLAYPEDNIVQLDLINGKVQFDVYEPNGSSKHKSYPLIPLHRLVFDKKSGETKTKEVPDSFYKYWDKGIYEFIDEPFVNLAKKIERIYSVKVIFNDDKELKECTFTGAFFIDSNIYTIMETFRRASSISFEYTFDKNQIHLKRENKMPM